MRIKLPENFTNEEKDLMIPNMLLMSLSWNLYEDQRIKNILYATEIILYYNLNWFHYTTETYRRMVELKDSVRTYLNTTSTNNRTAIRLFKRFKEALKYMERELEMADDLEME